MLFFHRLFQMLCQRNSKFRQWENDAAAPGRHVGKDLLP